MRHDVLTCVSCRLEQVAPPHQAAKASVQASVRESAKASAWASAKASKGAQIADRQPTNDAKIAVR
jgi:hypothetical protein